MPSVKMQLIICHTLWFTVCSPICSRLCHLQDKAHNPSSAPTGGHSLSESLFSATEDVWISVSQPHKIPHQQSCIYMWWVLSAVVEKKGTDTRNPRRIKTGEAVRTSPNTKNMLDILKTKITNINNVSF